MSGFRQLLWLALAVAILAGASTGAAAARTDVVLMLDNSGSMRTNDPEHAMPRAVTEFIRNLPEDTWAAVLLFDEQVRLVAPLAPLADSSRDALIANLDKLNYRGRLTNTSAAMERAIYELKNNGRAGAEKFIVFLTDGIIDTGNRARDAELSRWMREDLAGEAANAGIRTYGIAFTEAADFYLIQSVTHRTGGAYFRALTADDIRSAFAQIEAFVAEAPAPDQAAPSAPVSPTPEPTAATPSQRPTPLPATEAIVPEQRSEAREPEPRPAVAAAEQPPHPRVETATPAPTIPQPATTDSEPATAQPAPPVAESVPAAPATAAATGPEPAAPDPAAVGPLLGPNLPVVLIVVGGLLALGAFAAIVFLRHPKAAAGTEDRTALQEISGINAPLVALKDMSGVTGQSCHDITKKRIEIGRVAGNETVNVRSLVIDDDTISRRHAFIEYRDGGYWIGDLGSANGTFLNDERITGERLLKSGDRVRFHRFEFEFIAPPAQEAAGTVVAPAALVDEARTVVIGRSTYEEAVALALPRGGDRPPVPMGDERTERLDTGSQEKTMQPRQ